MKALGFRACTAPLVWILSVGMVMAADNSSITQVDWNTRTASCPAKVTQSTSSVIRVTNINDLLIDFKTGEVAQYQLRAKGTPVSVVPPENLFFAGQAGVVGATRPDRLPPCADSTLLGDLNAVVAMTNPVITPSQSGGRYISWTETRDAAHSAGSPVLQVEADMADTTPQCQQFFSVHSSHPVVQWIKRLNAQPGGNPSGAPPHSLDFNVNLEPNQNYQFTIQESWKGKVVDQGTLQWNCGETDILSLSVGPLITTLPYRTYNQQQVPVSGGGTQNQLVVGGGTNVNVLAAALLNYHFPSIPHLPMWTGFAFSVGPVFTLGNTPGVSKLGLFVGGSIHMYRSVFLTPGVHIGEFADFPAGFHQGSVIPGGFGSLTPVTRHTAHFAIGITFKTTSFKKSSQNGGAAANTVAAPKTGGTNPATPQQPVSGSHGAQTQHP
jgi:hypothetical protein